MSIYYVDTYSCKFSRKNTIICDLQKNEKMEVPIHLNSTNLNIIVSFRHFSFPYSVKTYMSRYQHNTYM
jgi:hypothetical protein